MSDVNITNAIPPSWADIAATYIRLKDVKFQELPARAMRRELERLGPAMQNALANDSPAAILYYAKIADEPRPGIQIPEEAWTQCGTPEDPTAKLYTRINILHVPMHLEAYAVEQTGTTWKFSYLPEEMDEIANTLGIELPMFVTIAGREYVMIAIPYDR